jgi:hypothetical protein
LSHHAEEFDKDEKENESTIGSQASAINDSFFKPTVSTVNSKQYLEEKV